MQKTALVSIPFWVYLTSFCILYRLLEYITRNQYPIFDVQKTGNNFFNYCGGSGGGRVDFTKLRRFEKRRLGTGVGEQYWLAACSE